VAGLTSSSDSWDSDRGARVLVGVSLVAPSLHCVLAGRIERGIPASECRDVPRGRRRSGVCATVAENCQTLGESVLGVSHWVHAEPIDPLPSLRQAGYADSSLPPPPRAGEDYR
jgi:hypothetical protein